MSSNNKRTKSCFSCLPLFPLLLLLCFSLTSAISFDGDVGPSRIALPTTATITRFGSMMSEEGVVDDECEENYGFLPCLKTAKTNMFLIVVYGYLIFVAATCLSKGSDLLSEILGVGIIGGFILPLLGSLPDALLILVSGLFGSITIAKDKLSVGMGLLAGATVVRLTVIWGTCMVVGKHNLGNSGSTIDESDSRGFNLLGSGVTTYIWTTYSSIVMVISVIPFLVVQFPQVISSTLTASKYSMLISFIFSSLLLIGYGLYQVLQPIIQENRIEYVKHKRVLTGFLKHLKQHAFRRLCNSDGTLNEEVIDKLFKRIDIDDDSHLCKGELRGFIIGMQFEGMSTDEDDIVDKVMKEFDNEKQDGKIDLDEFKNGIAKLLKRVKGHNASDHEDVRPHLEKYDEVSLILWY